ncbi:hypothetical protein J132_06909 [Termitomyces sp. J132]|nr:hypothetical protein J132_06909 [Termitomyces sp. J132]
MMLMVFWLLPLPIVSAAPVNLSAVSGSSACLAVFLSVLSLLSLLLISKRIYLKARKSQLTMHPEKSDLSARSSAPFLLVSPQDNSTKAAFLVGFFGSPAWETSLTNLVDKTESVDSHLDLSSNSYQYSDSRRSKFSQTPYSSLNNSVRGDLRSPSVSIADDVNGSCKILEAISSVQERACSLRLPNRPSLVYDASLSMITPRRFSMPTVSRRAVNSLGPVKRTSFQSANTTIGHADFSLSSLVSNPSLRLVQTASNSDKPLPLSSNQPKQCFSTRFNSSMPSSPTPHDRVLQSLPILRSRSATQSKNDCKLDSKDKRRISHPFALTSSSTYVIPTSSTNHKTHTHMRMGNVQREHTPTPRPLSPVLLSIDFSPLSVPDPSATLNHSSVSGSPVPSFREKNVVFPKIKQKRPRKSSLRPQRSPAIGPSPLRAMILPDPSDPTVAVRASVSQAGSQNSSHCHDYSSLGLDYPGSSLLPTWDAKDFKPQDKESVQAEKIKETHRATLDTEDANTLVGMIRELVEETDQWDASLFKNKNFKAMIDDSKQALNGCSNHGHVGDSSHYSKEAVQEDKSSEVDLSFLGLDIFRSGGETFIPILEDKRSSLHGDETHMVALWDDSSTAELGHSTQQ